MNHLIDLSGMFQKKKMQGKLMSHVTHHASHVTHHTSQIEKPCSAAPQHSFFPLVVLVMFIFPAIVIF
jgi:sterol desaturase/sphingolipid hydroxylase (fatty acid hydroxylase superfamily)